MPTGEIGDACVSHVANTVVMEFIDKQGMVHFIEGLGEVHHYDISLVTSLQVGCQLVDDFQKLGPTGSLLPESMLLVTQDVICLRLFIKWLTVICSIILHGTHVRDTG